jgi:short subunit dehydrogenase-like uncharacterized protein
LFFHRKLGIDERARLNSSSRLDALISLSRSDIHRIMMEGLKEFHLVVFGANAFTGKLATEYVSQFFPTEIRWAISGRNPEKLKTLYEELLSSPNPPKEYFVLDHCDRKKVADLVGKTQVALTFAGPFSRYSENIVASCSELGTHYLDIAGETVWVSKMIEKYESVAKRSGAILIPFSGFDSIPSDLGVWQVLQQAKETNPRKPITEVVGFFSAKGGINGGTFETFLEILENEKKEKKIYGDSSVLVPGEYKKKFNFSETLWPVYLEPAQLTAPPFIMAPINSRVVYRSQALRVIHQGDKQLPFRYTELQKVSPKFSVVQSWVMALGAETLKRIGRLSLGRKVLQSLGPKGGQGPSEEVRNSGYFNAQFFAYSEQQVVAQSQIYFKGDPGNKATVTMACESARCLILDQERLIVSGGFWTPSTALGGVLKDRLREAGMSFS